LASRFSVFWKPFFSNVRRYAPGRNLLDQIIAGVIRGDYSPEGGVLA
jgi:hypothetical protein